VPVEGAPSVRVLKPVLQVIPAPKTSPLLKLGSVMNPLLNPAKGPLNAAPFIPEWMKVPLLELGVTIRRHTCSA
jgi:hypothetical protein